MREATELLRIARALTERIGQTVRVRAPDLQKVIEAVPVPAGRFIVKYDDPSVTKFVDKLMKRKGFGRRMKGRGSYASDYWEKDGRHYRVKDTDGDVLILEDIMTGGLW